MEQQRRPQCGLGLCDGRDGATVELPVRARKWGFPPLSATASSGPPDDEIPTMQCTSVRTGPHPSAAACADWARSRTLPVPAAAKLPLNRWPTAARRPQHGCADLRGSQSPGGFTSGQPHGVNPWLPQWPLHGPWRTQQPAVRQARGLQHADRRPARQPSQNWGLAKPARNCSKPPCDGRSYICASQRRAAAYTIVNL